MLYGLLIVGGVALLAYGSIYFCWYRPKEKSKGGISDIDVYMLA